jgi:hypothetical protein
VDGDPTVDVLDTRELVGVWKEGRRWKMELGLIDVVGHRAEQGLPVGPPGAVPPDDILGDFEDDYGNRFTVTAGAWRLNDSARYAVMRWDADGGFVIAHNGPDNPGDAGLWSRFDWVLLEGMEPWTWALCTSAYDAPTPEAAIAAAIANRAELRTGCNGFPFSRMRRVGG